MIISILIAFNEELDLKSLLTFNKEESEDDEDEEDEEDAPIKFTMPMEEPEPVKAPEKKKEKEKVPEKKKEEKALKVTAPEEEMKGLIKVSKHDDNKEYTPPPLTLLERDKGKPVVGDVKANANIIKRTLANFGIDVEMDEVSIGPSVTRYALKPAEGG